MLRDGHTHLASTVITYQLGIALAALLSLMFLSGGMFYLYVFNYDIGPYFTVTRVIHFYAGLASIPFLLAKYGSTSFRFAGYYIGMPRLKRGGPPGTVPRVMSPLLALDFFVLYFSGLYMLFHYYYTITNIPPFEFKPVQMHLWAALLAVPLLAIHLGWHLVETARGLATERHELLHKATAPLASERRALTRRGFIGTVVAGGLGLAIGFQNTPLARARFHGLFISRVPAGERGGPGDFPVETLFGREEVDPAAWSMTIVGVDGSERSIGYAQLMALPAAEHTIRLNCVSGWSSSPTWRGPRVRDVLVLAGDANAARSVQFHSLTGYAVTWHRRRLGDDALLATHVNGAPLSLDHGFPARLIAPGYPGQNMVKQIDRITLRAEEERIAPDFKLVRDRAADCCREGEA